MKNNIEFLRAGSLSTIQDLRRNNSRVYGIPRSGPMDHRSHMLSNWLLGKDLRSETIEMTLIGPKIKFNFNTNISLCGANSECLINNKKVDMNTTLIINEGDILDIKKIKKGNWIYLSISAEIVAEKYFDSLSTYERSEIGGINGVSIRNGDKINLLASQDIDQKKIPKDIVHDFDEKIIRVIKGPEYYLFDDINYFTDNEFKISPSSDRMGIRLENVGNNKKFEINLESSPVVEGTIQVPPDGNPIVLMKDSQTTGGYPRIGIISSVDISKISQIRANKSVKFRFISLDESNRLIDYDKKKYKSRLGVNLVS